MSPLPKLITREAGATGALLCPSSRWTSVSGAILCTSYDTDMIIKIKIKNIYIYILYITCMYEGNVRVYIYIYSQYNIYEYAWTLTHHSRLLLLSLCTLFLKGIHICSQGASEVGSLNDFESSRPLKQLPHSAGHCAQEQSLTMQVSLPVSATKSNVWAGSPMETLTDEYSSWFDNGAQVTSPCPAGLLPFFT